MYVGQGNSAIAIGNAAAQTYQAGNAIAIGNAAAQTNQGNNAVAIGYSTGNFQGNGAIAIGALASANAQPANSIIINASGTAITANNAGFYAAPVRSDVSNVGNIMYYNPASREMTYSNVINLNNVVANSVTGISNVAAVTYYNYKELVTTTAYTATFAPDMSTAGVFKMTLTGNFTFNGFGGTPQAGQSGTFIFTQDSTGSRTMTSSMKFAGGNKTLSTTPNVVDMVYVFYDGSTYYATLTKAFQ
jgi:hypothetical protein